MKRFWLAGSLLLAVIFGFAQGRNTNIITGKIIDSVTKTPLEYATVSIYLSDPKKPINGAATDKNGVFSITDVADSTYTVVVEFIGYKPTSITNVSVSHSTVNLKTIVLAHEAKALQGITITAKGRLIENKIDKMVFNAEKDVTSQSGVATDILKKVPQVSVDADGNVQLAGSGGVRFLINGKPSSAFGSSITDVLQSIPASQIKSIEVITNPGAKYDAAGMGGIINIILKSSNAKGYNGSLALTAGTLQENGSLNFNVRNGAFGVNAFVSGNARLKSTVYSTSDRIATANNQQTILHQDGQGQFTRSGYQTGFGFDWTPQKHNAFSGSLSYNNFGNKGTGISTQDQQYYTGNTLGNILSRIESHNDFRFHNIDWSLNYKRKFDKEDRELEVNVNSSFGKDNSSSGNSQFLLPQDSLYYGTTSQNPGNVRETEMRIDYTEPLQKDVVLGLGSKVSLYDINSNSAVLRYLPVEKAHSSFLEIGWTILPAILLLFMAVPSFCLLYSLDELTKSTMTLKIVGHQWFWSYEYLETSCNEESVAFDSYIIDIANNPNTRLGMFRILETDNRVVLPIKTHVKLLITSGDVLHSWAVPSFGIKVDACPGRLTEASLFIKRKGVFYGQCSEICGVNHGFMPIVVAAVDFKTFINWLFSQKEVTEEVINLSSESLIQNNNFLKKINL